jgi:hydrogenase maturation protease
LSLHIQPAPDLAASLTIHAESLPSSACKLHLELENSSPLSSGAEARRDEALPLSLVSAHLLLGVTDGEFVSLLEPPGLYTADARACANTGVFPVLAGDEPDRSILLLSPIIMYDYPKTSLESAGDFFDGTEMDEMLTLRVLTLTDAEKDEMRNGDPHARRILERTEALTGEEMLKTHGTIRSMREIRGDIS